MSCSGAVGWEGAIFTALHGLLFTSCPGAWALRMDIIAPGHRKKDSTLDSKSWNCLLQAAAGTVDSEVFPTKLSRRKHPLFGAGHVGWCLQPPSRTPWASARHKEHLSGCCWEESWGHPNPCSISWGQIWERMAGAGEKRNTKVMFWACTFFMHSRLSVSQKPWWRLVPFLSFGPWPRPPTFLIFFFFFKLNVVEVPT